MTQSGHREVAVLERDLPLLCGRLAGQFYFFGFGCFGHRKAAHDAIEGLQWSVRAQIGK